MKVLHVTFSFPPDPPGGTEIYVAALARDLGARGVRSVIAAPDARARRYQHEGTPVARFVADGDLDVAAVYGAGDPKAAAAFDELLATERPDVVHQHALTAACSPLLMKAAKAHGASVVLTYHTPATSCLRGTLLRWGAEPCDGRLRRGRCAACALEARNVPRPVARLLGALPAGAGRWLGRVGLRGGGWTAARMSALTDGYHDRVRTALALADRVVVPARWAADVLRQNGLQAPKVSEIRHGIEVPRLDARRPAAGTGSVRIAHLGRLSPEKGTGLLVRALASKPQLPVRLDIFGIEQGGAASALKRDLEVLVDRDDRVRLRPALPPADVIATLADYDVVAVPSQWLETGPLVVLEAFAAGVPVLGSKLGGIAEWVTHGRDGWLVEPFDDPRAWADALERCIDRRWIANLTSGVRPPRSAGQVADEMLQLYVELCSDPHASRAVASA